MNKEITLEAVNKRQSLNPEDVTCPEEYAGWSLTQLTDKVKANHFGFACEFAITGVKGRAYARHIAGDPNKKNCSAPAGVLIKRNPGVQAVIAKVFNLGA